VRNICAKTIIALSLSSDGESIASPSIAATSIPDTSFSLPSSSNNNLDELMVLGGVLPILSSLIASASNAVMNQSTGSEYGAESIALAVLAGVNIAAALTDNDVEALVRMLMLTIKRLEVSRYVTSPAYDVHLSS
jgi:hypothetical protein